MTTMGHHPLIGDSPALAELIETIELVGPRRSTVLITGESGTGKELVARAIHMASPRASSPLVSVNCGALPEPLLEAELFGHTRGAFTGAVQPRVGRFELAHRGTLFLDEIGDMPLDSQSKLLRALQEGEIQRLGSSEAVKVDVRVIAATNVDLESRIKAREFREDLFYRLNVIPIHLPALRERRSDIPMLVEHFVAKVCRMEGLPVKEVSRDALIGLLDYSWPGNIRQLENAVEMAVVMSGRRETLEYADFHLPRDAGPPPGLAKVIPFISVPDEGLDFEKTITRLERTLLEQAMQKTRGNKKRAAEILRLKRTTLAAKLKSVAVGY